MAEPLPNTNRCSKCGEWFHTAHVCAKDAARVLPTAAAPATPAEAEELAKKFVGEYLTACRMNDRAQIGNYLMKLCSVAGIVMAQAEGCESAATRLEGTAAFVRKSMPADPSSLRPVH